MQRLDPVTVQLTDDEMAVKEEFEDALDRGISTVDAVIALKKKYGDKLSRDFYLYLGDGKDW